MEGIGMLMVERIKDARTYEGSPFVCKGSEELGLTPGNKS